MKETETQLHSYILEQMREVGEPSPSAFQKVMAREPGLLERYLRSCGIEVEHACLNDSEYDRIHMNVEMKDHKADQNYEIRFLREA